MSHLLTRAEMRDKIRRMIGIVPPVDVNPANPPGQQPTNYPVPTNANINDSIEQAASDINRKCGFHVETYKIPLGSAPAGVYGPFALSLADLTPNSASGPIIAPQGHLNDILRVLWTPSGSVPQLLAPGYRDVLDRAGNDSYYSALPGQPQGWWIEGYSLYVYPAQDGAGTLTLTAGTGLIGLQCDDETLDQVPIDYQQVVLDRATFRLALSQSMDAEAQTRAQSYGPISEFGMQQFKDFKLGGTGAPEPSLGFVSYRRGYGTRRVVR